MTREKAIEVLLRMLAREQLRETGHGRRLFQERITALEMAIQLMERASDDDFLGEEDGE